MLNWLKQHPFLAACAIIAPLFAIFSNTKAILEGVNSAYRAVWPKYETSIEFSDHLNTVNRDGSIGARLKATRNDQEYRGFTSCSWSADNIHLGDSCVGVNFQPDRMTPQIDIAKREHRLAVSLKTSWGNDLPAAEAPFFIRNFDSPTIVLQGARTTPPTLYTGERAALSLVMSNVNSDKIRYCRWQATTGTVVPKTDNSCAAEYQAPDVLSRPPDPMDAELTATADVMDWSDVPSKPLKLVVAAPAENVYEYVFEASARMRSDLFEQARARILGDLDELSAAKGYLGVLTLGSDAVAPGAECTPSVLLPLNVPGSDARPKIEAVRRGRTPAAPVLAAWQQSVEDYNRLKSGRRFQNPRLFLVTLTAGRETCSHADPVAFLRQLDINITRAKLDRDWRNNRLLTFTIVTGDLPVWRNALQSKEYRESQAMLILSDDVSVVTSSLAAIAQLASGNRQVVNRACETLQQVMQNQNDERGQGRVGQACGAIRAAFR